LRLLLALVAAITLITADLHFNRLEMTRSVLDTAAAPLYWIADVPARLAGWSDANLRSRDKLQEDNDRLRRENLVLEGRSQQMASLRAENTRLRALLNSSALVQDDILVAELIGVSPDPVRHEVILNKGSADGVYIGQPLIDADGLIGQVTHIGGQSARVLLVTDSTHSVPVQVNRNAVRGIAEGVGRLDTLVLHHVAATTDIQEGDLLVTSGLGGRFPEGYPVATVTLVERNPGRAFARILAKPTAALDRSRHVLLVFTDAGAEQP
jgi:rod shape-determining protein MreC